MSINIQAQPVHGSRLIHLIPDTRRSIFNLFPDRVRVREEIIHDGNLELIVSWELAPTERYDRSDRGVLETLGEEFAADEACCASDNDFHFEDCDVEVWIGYLEARFLSYKIYAGERWQVPDSGCSFRRDSMHLFDFQFVHRDSAQIRRNFGRDEITVSRGVLAPFIHGFNRC